MNRFAIRTCVLVGLLNLGYPSWALELNPAELRGNQDRNPVSVLQNRYFTKTLRPEFGLALGSFLNEAYTNTSLRGIRASLFLREWLGVEVQSFDTSVTSSEDRKALNRQVYKSIEDDQIVSPDPEVNNVSGIRDFNVVLAPFYGKLNLMNQMILYSDLYFTSGLSQVQTSQGDLTAAILGAGQRFYFLESFSFRVDFRDRIYSEKRGGSKTRKHSYSVDFGLSYFFL